MTSKTIETAPTMMNTPRQPLRPPSNRWIWVVVGLAFAILIAALVLANFRNLALQERLANCKAAAAKCVTDANEMARQVGNAARISLDKLDDEEDSEPAEQPVVQDQPIGIDAGTDSLKHEGTEKWK